MRSTYDNFSENYVSSAFAFPRLPVKSHRLFCFPSSFIHPCTLLRLAAAAAVVSKLGGGGDGSNNLRGSSSALASEKGPFKPDTWDILLISDLDKKVRCRYRVPRKP